MQRVTIRNPNELQLGEARVFQFMRKGRNASGFLIRHHEGLFAYYNRCCHWPVQLDLDDGQFYDERIDRIVCKTHGACYLVDSGYCDAGPCTGAQLEAYTVELSEDSATVLIPDEADPEAASRK